MSSLHKQETHPSFALYSQTLQKDGCGCVCVPQVLQVSWFHWRNTCSFKLQRSSLWLKTIALLGDSLDFLPFSSFPFFINKLKMSFTRTYFRTKFPFGYFWSLTIQVEIEKNEEPYNVQEHEWCKNSSVGEVCHFPIRAFIASSARFILPKTLLNSLLSLKFEWIEIMIT